MHDHIDLTGADQNCKRRLTKSFITTLIRNTQQKEIQHRNRTIDAEILSYRADGFARNGFRVFFRV